MIATLKQESTGRNISYSVIDNHDQILCEIEAPFSTDSFYANFYYDGQLRQKLYYNPTDTQFGMRLSDRLSFKLFEDKDWVGALIQKTQKAKGFLQSYPYYQIEISDQEYQGYAVGFGKKGLYLCFYQNEECLAVVEKELVTRQYQDIYHLYLLSDQTLPALLPFLVYYDMTQYGDVMEYSLHSYKKTTLNTIQKELIKKYDPDFIQRVIDEERSGE